MLPIKVQVRISAKCFCAEGGEGLFSIFLQPLCRATSPYTDGGFCVIQLLRALRKVAWLAGQPKMQHVCRRYY